MRILVKFTLGSFLNNLFLGMLLAFCTYSPASASDCNLAPHYFSIGKFTTDKEKPLQYFEKAIEVCPGYIRPYELIGNIYRKQAKNDRALSYFKKAAELGSKNNKLYYYIALLEFEKGELENAIRNINLSLEIRPEYPAAVSLKKKIEKARDDQGPQIVLYEPSDSSLRGVLIVQNYVNMTVRGTAIDRSGVAWVKINRNDASLDAHGNFFKEIQIQTGRNTIVIESADTLGNSSRIILNVEGEKYTLPAIPSIAGHSTMKQLYSKSHAVVIGINQYEKWPVLEFAVNDALAIKEALLNAEFDNITMILDTEATQRRILTELFHTLPQKVGRNDRLLFYFAGHGQTEELPGDGRRGYIIPADSEISNYSATAISMEQIKSLSSRIKAKHILYVMDSCYSGLGFNRAAGIDPMTSDYLKKLASMRVVQIITAGGKGEQVQERQGHGLFTTYFLKGIKGAADYDGDLVVTGSELGTYLRPTVSNASRQAQTPLFGRLEGEGEFLFFVGTNQ